jgi:[calcium/calmodulin-dependent protein kinase] kinase
MLGFGLRNNLAALGKRLSQAKPGTPGIPRSSAPWRIAQQSFLSSIRDDSTLGVGSKRPVRIAPRRRVSSVMSTSTVRKTKSDGQVMINQYIVEKTLGKGSFAIVKLCRDSITNEKYAIKQMNKKVLQTKKCGPGRNAYDCVIEELKVLKTLDHPHIIWLHEIIDDPKRENIYLVTKWLQRGSLGKLVEEKNDKFDKFNKQCREEGRDDEIRHTGLDVKSIRLYFIDMLKALFYCHKVAKVIHRDIKPDNIVISHNNEAVLIDFGVSALVDDGGGGALESNMGSYMFFAPEMFKSGDERKEVRGETTDLWALGVTFYYLTTGRFPCQDAKNPLHLKELVTGREINFEIIKNEPLRSLLRQMLQKDPSRRADLNGILKDPWVTDNGKKMIQIDKVDQYKDGENGFGNLQRLMKQRQRSKGTARNLMDFKSKTAHFNEK